MPKVKLTVDFDGLKKMDFYLASEVVPRNFTTIIDACSEQEDHKYYVSVQSAEQFYRQIRSEVNTLGFGQNYVGRITYSDSLLRGGDSTEQVSKLQCNHTVYLKRIHLADQHVPNCSDFVVFLFKKENCLRVMRLYQCRCDLQMFPLQQGHYYED